MKTRPEILDYIRAASDDLAHLADEHHWDMLAYLFRMARLESDKLSPASSQRRPQRPAPSASPSGYWDWDIARDRIYGDECAAELFNIDREAGRRGTPLHDWQRALHPDDFDHVATQLMNSVQTGSEYNARFRVIAPDQTIRHVEAQGRCLFDPEGRPSRFPGSIRQVRPSVTRLSEVDIDVILKRGRQTH